MEQETHISAEEGKHDLLITREFELPLDALFSAFVEPEIVEAWMGTKVLKLENRSHGAYQFETTDPKGNKHGFHGVIHEFSPERRITRTFEMANTPFGVQLELLQFESLTAETSKLTMHVIYESPTIRDQVLAMPFAQGINLAHNRLQQTVNNLL